MEERMYRRDFLKLGGLFSVTLLMKFNPLGKGLYLPAEVSSQGMSYRGASAGRVYVSSNAGKNWQLHTNFGAAYSVLGLTADHSGQIHAQLDFGGRSFELALTLDGKAWSKT